MIHAEPGGRVLDAARRYRATLAEQCEVVPFSRRRSSPTAVAGVAAPDSERDHIERRPWPRQWQWTRHDEWAHSPARVAPGVRKTRRSPQVGAELLPEELYLELLAREAELGIGQHVRGG